MTEDKMLEIRHFGVEETAAMTELSADVGWNQPADEISEIIERSGKYLLGAFSDGKLIGVVAGYAYHQGGFVYINEVIVHSEWRRRGVATGLLKRLLPLVTGDYPIMRLCATAMGRPLYERFGFFPYATLSFGDLSAAGKPDPAGGEFIPLTNWELPQVCRLDQENFGADRSAILCSLVRRAPRDAWCLTRGGMVAGFIVRAPMNWLLQAGSARDMAALLLYANAHSAKGAHPALIRREHVEQLGVPFNEHFQLTLMQHGGSVPPPGATFSGFLPDIG